MNMQVSRAAAEPAGARESRPGSRQAPALPAAGTQLASQAPASKHRPSQAPAGKWPASRRIYLPKVAIAGLAWTVLIVEAAGVVLLLLTAAVQQQRPAR